MMRCWTHDPVVHQRVADVRAAPAIQVEPFRPSVTASET
jgi:hypothetical protein